MRVLYDDVAARAGVDPDQRQARIPHPGRAKNSRSTINAFERDVRWAAQRAKFLGLAEPGGDAEWVLSGKGAEKLHATRPGLVVRIFVSDTGAILCGDAEDALGYVDDGSVQLLLTSPPYPILREKAYGGMGEEQWLSWFLRLAERWPDKLAPNGSVVLNLGDAWVKGAPLISTYQETLLQRLASDVGLRLAERHFWLNPSKLPAPAQWVTIERVRVKPAIEQIYVLSRDGRHYSDNRSILQDYSDAMRKRLADGGETGANRPSGHALKEGAFGKDNGGAIANNLIVAPNTVSNSDWQKRIKAAGLPPHPARYPEALPERFIRYLTRPGDVVLDPFLGSGTTAVVAERLDRRWIGFERMKEYAQAAAIRIQTCSQPAKGGLLSAA